MKSLLLSLMLLPLVALAGEIASADLEDLVAADSEVVLIVEDVPHVLNSLREHPVTRAWNDDNVNWAFRTLRSRLKISIWDRLVQKALGYSLDEVYGVFPRRALLALPHKDPDTVLPAPWGVIADASADTHLSEALFDYLLSNPYEERMKLRGEIQRSDFMGIELHLQRYEIKPALEHDAEEDELDSDQTEHLPAPVPLFVERGWARIGSRLVFAQGADYLRELVGNVVSGHDADPWSQSEQGARLVQWTGKADVRGYVRAAALGSEFGGAGHSLLDLNGGSGGATHAAVQVLGGLAADSLDALYAGVGFDKEQTWLDANVRYRDDRGLFKLITLRPGLTDLPGFVPEHASEMQVMNFSLPGFWRAMLELSHKMPTVGLMATPVRLQLQKLSKDVGMDLEQALMKSLGDQVISAVYPGKLGEGDDAVDYGYPLIALRLKDQRTFEVALNALAGASGWNSAVRQERFLDTTIYVMRDSEGRPRGMPTPAYAVSDGYVLFSTDPKLLREAITRLRHPQRYSSVWREPVLSEALDSLPEGASAVSFVEPAHYLDQIFTRLLAFQRRIPIKGEGGCRPHITLDRSALDGFLSRVVQASYKQSNRLRTVVRLSYGEK